MKRRVDDTTVSLPPNRRILPEHRRHDVCFSNRGANHRRTVLVRYPVDQCRCAQVDDNGTPVGVAENVVNRQSQRVLFAERGPRFINKRQTVGIGIESKADVRLLVSDTFGKLAEVRRPRFGVPTKIPIRLAVHHDNLGPEFPQQVRRHNTAGAIYRVDHYLEAAAPDTVGVDRGQRQDGIDMIPRRLMIPPDGPR